MALPPKVYQFLVGVFASLGPFLFGYDLTIIAAVISSSSFVAKFNPNATELGLVVAIFTGGAFVGAAIGGPAGDFIGRRWTITLGSVIFIIGGALQTGAENIDYLYSGRFLAGVGVGILTMIVPLYQAEVAHPDIRGLVVGLQQFMLGIGGVCGSWISYGCFQLTDDRQWRVPFGVQIVPALFLGLLILFFPESPRWLLAKGKSEKGLKTLARLHSKGDESDAWVIAEYEQIQDSITYEQENQARSYKELFTELPNLRRMIIAMACQAATQMTGVSAIQYYSTQIFSQMGIVDNDTLKYQAVGTILGLLGELLLMLLVDRLGRRWTMIGGNLVMCGTFVISTALLSQFPPDSNNISAHWAFIVFTSWVYNFTFGFSTGPLSWIIPAEIFDTKTRSKGVGIAAMTSFAFNTMIGQVTSIAIPAIGWRFFLLFCVTNFTNAVFFWAFLPETKKLPLEEMQRMFVEAPWFVPGMNRKQYGSRAINDRVRQITEKEGGR